VEEVDLRGIQTSWACWDGEVNGSNATDTGFSWDLVGFEFALEFEDWSVCEDEGDLVLEERNESSEFGDESAEVLLEVLKLVFFDAFSSHLDDLLGESVLIDDKVGSVGSECLTDLVDLA